MLVTSHAAAGAIIGRTIGRPAAAFAAGLISHLAMDRTHHWGTVDRNRFLQVARVDGLTMLAAAGHLISRSTPGFRTAVAAGVAGAVLPDLDKPFKHLLGVNLFPRRVGRFLAEIQHGREKGHRLPYEIIAVIILTAAAHMAVTSVRSGSPAGAGHFVQDGGAGPADHTLRDSTPRARATTSSNRAIGGGPAGPGAGSSEGSSRAVT